MADPQAPSLASFGSLHAGIFRRPPATPRHRRWVWTAYLYRAEAERRPVRECYHRHRIEASAHRCARRLLIATVRMGIR